MKKGLVVCVVVAASLGVVGCYSKGPVTKEELNEKGGEFDIVVITKDLTRYDFAKGDYHIHGDTLSGAGTRTIIRGDATAIDASISSADIGLIESSQFSPVKTILAVGGIGVGFVILMSFLAGLH
ncbi:MAG TPA: hypothetical protein VK569_09935 [Bacteroidota bacterium]|nr:hypothetical protein [Bacteroidota bacterium]